MQGARIAPRELPSGIAAGLILLLCCLCCVFAPSARAAIPATVTIDFSQHGQGSFEGSFFSQHGVQFTEGSFVGYVQGDDALVGPAAGTVKKGFASISARFAPAGQGTAIYTLTALGSSGRTLGSSSVTVTQDTGDPETGPFGYVPIELGPLSKKATSFRLSNSFVRSSYSHITQIEFGVSAITISR